MTVTTTTGVVTAVTWSTTDKTNMTLSGGNLTAIATTTPSSWNALVRATKGYVSGKYYAEFTIIANSGTGPGDSGFGIANSSQSNYIGSNPANAFGYYPLSGGLSDFTTFVSTSVAGDVVGIAYDFDNSKLWIRVNNGNWNNDVSANPATNTNGKAFSIAGRLYPIYQTTASTPSATANFGATGWSYTPPAKFFGFSRTETVVVITGSTTSYTLPSDYDSNFNQWHVIGGGGGMSQGTPNVEVDGSGAGGAFSIKSGLSGTPSSTVVTMSVGSAGAGGGAHATNGTAGGDTWASTSSSDTTIAGGSVFVGAKGGGRGVRNNGTASGGAAASGVGDKKLSGGNSGSTGASGGGGAAGQDGAGGNGANPATANGTVIAGGGGGGPSGGSAGVGGSGSNGGNGGTDASSTGAGAGGASGSNGADGTTGGGGGAGWTTGQGSTHGGKGGTVPDYGTGIGPGGGGGGSGGGGQSGSDNTSTTASGGTYGGGAGCAWAGEPGGGAGGAGLLVLRYYTPTTVGPGVSYVASQMFLS